MSAANAFELYNKVLFCTETIILLVSLLNLDDAMMGGKIDPRAIKNF